jgi:hypothetical protein
MTIFNHQIRAMKKFLFIFLLLPLYSISQDCKLKKDTDPFTHETKLSTGFVPFNTDKVQISLSIDATSTNIDFFFWIKEDGKCFDNNSAAVINYDGERLKSNFKNSGSMNCEGAFHISFRNVVNTPSNLNWIATKKIKSIRLTGNNNAVTEIELTDEQKQKLMQLADCVIKSSKSLIKQ